MRNYTTQMEAARKGIITPEMKAVAAKEYRTEEEIRDLVAKGQVVILSLIHIQMCIRDMDLYCGIGTISLFFAQKAKHVFGVEIVPEAIADAKRNAALNGMDNADFAVGAAEDVIPRLYEEKGITADVVVVCLLYTSRCV